MPLGILTTGPTLCQFKTTKERTLYETPDFFAALKKGNLMKSKRKKSKLFPLTREERLDNDFSTGFNDALYNSLYMNNIQLMRRAYIHLDTSYGNGYKTALAELWLYYGTQKNLKISWRNKY